MIINRLSNLSSLVDHWDAPSLDTASNISSDDPGDRETSVVYAKTHPKFLESIEPGIRPLVLRLIEKLNCITYSSCEGHPTVDGRVHVGRHVDILPRNLEEQSYLVEVLSSIATATPSAQFAKLRVVRGTLDVETSKVPSVSIEFIPTPGCAWETYATDADALQRFLEDALLSRG